MEAPHDAIRGFLQQLQQLSRDFSRDSGAVLAPLAAKCIEEAAGDGGWLLRVFESFGWNGHHFADPIDVVAFTSRLKALMFDGLQHKGQGSYATVYKARDRLTGEVITLKKLRIDEQGGEGLSGPAIREVSLLKDLHHPNIVCLKDVLWDIRRLYLIMEYLDCDLQEYLASSHTGLPVTDIKVLLHQLLSGVRFCHSHRILHRDLKPQNILVDQKSKLLKIADFGLARCFTLPHRTYTHEVVTLLYRAPEILLGTAIYTTAVDMWSVGCIFAELYLGVPLFQGDSEIGQLYKIFQVLGTPNRSLWPGVSHLPDWQPGFPQWEPQELHKVIPRMDALALDLLEQLLCYRPERRMTARQALDHPFLAGISARSPQGAPVLPPAVTRSPEKAGAAPQAGDSAYESTHLLPAVRAVKLTDMCRSHSDPGLRREGSREAEADGKGGKEAGVERGRPEHGHEGQKQQSRLGHASTERVTTRSMDHRSEAPAPLSTGRTMKTRSMTAAEEAAHVEHGGGSSSSQLSAEHTSKPATTEASCQQKHAAEMEEQSAGKTCRQKAKSSKPGKPGKAAAGQKPREEEEGLEKDASDVAVSSELSDQTTVDLGEEVLPRRKGKA